MEKRNVIIMGGGIGGLCTAIALQQAGFQVKVYEKAKKFGEVGAGITLWSNAIKVARALGFADAIIAAGSKIQSSQIRVHDGEALVDAGMGEMEGLFGEPIIAIHRADLHEILVKALAPNTVAMHTSGVRFEQDEKQVTVFFEDGQRDSADFLIGADGIHSTIRKQMFPDITLRYSGYTAWRGVVETENEAALGLTSETWGRGARFGIVRVDRKRVYWFATHSQPAGEKVTAEERKAKLQGIFKGWHHPIDHLLDSTPAEAILQNDIFDIAPYSSWTKGRVTLLGDAAHPTTPNMGQGACMAMESAYCLARALREESDHAAAFARYERERHERTAWITNTSWTIGRGGQIENGLLVGLRNFIAKITPAKALQKNLHRAAGFDVTKVSL
jgi:FAD-dependent urate hydroxylase